MPSGCEVMEGDVRQPTGDTLRTSPENDRMLITMPLSAMVQPVGPLSPDVATDQSAAALPPASPPTAATDIAQTVPTGPSQPDATGEIVVTGRRRSAGDPLEAINARSFEATQAVDKAVFGPVALAYKRAMPSPVRSGLRNFFKNLREPVVFVNYVLQLKPGKAAETAGRFAVNTTIGVAGFVDMAKRKPFNLPRRPNGFAYTLGYYGVKPGPFIFLPFFGPTTVRDAIGGLIDRAVVPGIGGPPFNQPAYVVPATGLGVLDRRAEFDEDLQRIRASADPYVARRDFYLRKRQREIDALHASSPSHAKVTDPSSAPPPASSVMVPINPAAVKLTQCSPTMDAPASSPMF